MQVEWRATGPNTSAKFVNIKCPWCYDDPSFHLRISRESGGFYCLRDSRHKGANPLRWLIAVKVSRRDAQKLVHQYDRGGNPGQRVFPVFQVKPQEKAWRKFLSAVEHTRSLNYLRSRGFPNAEEVAEDFDLRYAPHGEWAARLLIPYKNDGVVFGWTGRAFRDTLMPKYKMQEDLGEALYIPGKKKQVAMLFEGQIDALKVEAALTNHPCFTIAMGGLSLGASKALQLRAACQESQQLLFVGDNDVPLGRAIALTQEISGVLPGIEVRRVRVPAYAKDAGAMSYKQVRTWLADIITI